MIPERVYKQAVERMKRLERLLGQKTEEVDILKEAVRLSREKNKFGAIRISVWELHHEWGLSNIRRFSL